MGGVFFRSRKRYAVSRGKCVWNPIASKIVFHQAKNLLIFPLNVTNKAVLTPNVFDYIQANSKNPFHTIMKPMYDYYFSAYQKLNPSIEGPLLHDVVCYKWISKSKLLNLYIVQ